MTDPKTDPDILTHQAYATDEHLAVRYRTHELYSYPKIDFQQWVVDTLTWRGDEQVLDIGAGPGTYFEAIQRRAPDGLHVAGDLSFGMIQRAQRSTYGSRVRLLTIDVQNLPFADETFDVVLANHMLYHVPDIDRALSEIRRVMRYDGCLIAATNSENNMPELDTLARRACTLLGYPKQDFRPDHLGFALENGPMMLAHYFRAIARYDLPSAFHFPEVAPVMAYLNSGRALREPHLPEGVAWNDFMAVMEKQITRLIRHFGELQVQKLAGVFVATNGGGFAREFLQMLNGRA